MDLLPTLLLDFALAEFEHISLHPMTPPTLFDDSQHYNNVTRPSKKPRLTHSVPVEDSHSDQVTAVRRHPLGVRPSGNAFTADINLKSAAGLFALLPDELLAQLLDLLDAADLLRLGATCRALHAFTRNEELWRALFVE